MSNRDVNPAARPLPSSDPVPAAPVIRPEHSESAITRLLEQQTARIPSDVFLFAALSSMGVSLGLQLSGRYDSSRFVGMWAPALLAMGIYNKLVKVMGTR